MLGFCPGSASTTSPIVVPAPGLEFYGCHLTSLGARLPLCRLNVSYECCIINGEFSSKRKFKMQGKQIQDLLKFVKWLQTALNF